MKILALDTAMSSCSVALVDYNHSGNVIECSKSKSIVKGHAEYLVPMIQSVVSDSGCLFDDIDLLAVTKGPGAFTGIRVGLATAGGMSLALSVPVAGFSTTQAMAYTYLRNSKPVHKGNIIVLIETKRKDYYCEIFDGKGNTLFPVFAGELDEIKKHISKEDILIGDAVQRFCYESGEEFHVFGGEFTKIDAVALAYKAIEKFENEKITSEEIMPLYVGNAGVSFSKKTTKTIADL